MLKVILGIFIGWATLALGISAFFFAGLVPVATKAPPLPLEKFLARTAIHKAISGSLKLSPPIPANDENIVAGAKIYSAQCSVCHSVPDHDPSFIAKGMFPRPPHLFRHPVDDDPIGETYWKIKNGIRLTGMPGFEGSLSESEIWQVSLFLVQGEKISEAAKQFLKPTN